MCNVKALWNVLTADIQSSAFTGESGDNLRVDDCAAHRARPLPRRHRLRAGSRPADRQLGHHRQVQVK